MLSGQGVPDIIHPYSLHLGKIRESLHPMDAWLADDEIMTAPNGEKLSLDVVLPIAMETVKSPDDKIYMIPKDMSEVLLYYRADLMATPPETWDEFTALALEYTRGVNPGSPTRYGAAMQGKYEMWTFCAALENLWPHGVDVFGPLTREDERAIARGLRVFETLAEAGALPPGAVNAEHPEVAAIIKRGDVAMAIQWSAFYQELRGKEPSPGVCDKFEVAPPPGVRGADGVVDRFIYTQTINLALNKHSPRKREAMKFLAWAALGEGAVIYAKAGGSSPVKAVWERDGISDLYPRILPWVERYGRAAPTHPRLTEMMMIGSSWVQRVIAREETAARAAAGLAADARKARAASGEGTK
ncbi:MAG: extracellular solute-binding protein [Desulfobacterales bacterium]|nr:extracellular solute-binding protein [Desulfobacterales bacterium]